MWNFRADRLSAVDGPGSAEVELHHKDLPKTSEEPYVRDDPETKLVELTGAPPELDAVIHVARGIERPERNP